MNIKTSITVWLMASLIFDISPGGPGALEKHIKKGERYGKNEYQRIWGTRVPVREGSAAP